MIESAVDTLLPEGGAEASPQSDAVGPYAPAFEPRPGLVLADRYELIKPLGRGSSGWVWKAKHVVIGKHFAVKVLAPRSGTLGDAASVRMLREAKTLSSVEHPHVIAVTDFGYARRGTPFIVMELLEGEPLRAVLDAGALSWEQARVWGVQILEGVEAAHRQGVIHRDIKAANLFVTARDERIKVLDFGLAHIDDEAEARTGRITAAGAVFGTPTTMSPEQIAGAEVDARTDLYSLGCVLYEMIGGRPAVHGESAEVLYQHVYADPDPLRTVAPAEVPDAVCEMIDRCLAKDPADRPASVTDVRKVFDRRHGPRSGPRSGPSVSKPVPAASTHSGKAVRRIAAASVAVGGLFALVAAGWPTPKAAIRPVQVSLPTVRPREVAVPSLRAELPVLERAVPKTTASPEPTKQKPRTRRTARHAGTKPAGKPKPGPTAETPQSIRPPAADERVADLKNPFSGR